MLCGVFGVSSSGYYDYRRRQQQIDIERLALKARLRELFKQSRSSAGSRTLKTRLNAEGMVIGRFKVRRLMQELGLVSKQPGAPVYQRAAREHPKLPNWLDRKFDVRSPNQVWCGDITYLWTGNCWSYLAVVWDLYARRAVGWSMSNRPDADLVTRALQHAWEQRGRLNRPGFFGGLRS